MSEENKSFNNNTQILSPNIYKVSNIKNTSKTQSNFFSNGRDNIPKVHPLDFYCLGKYSGNSIFQEQQYNKGIKSTSSDIINRNALSINTNKFNGVVTYKNLSYLKDQNIGENNYMDPISVFKSSKKYDILKCATNCETYKIMKEKFFSRDVQNNILKGEMISKTDFIREKTNPTSKNKETHKEKKGRNKKCFNEIGLIYNDPNDYSKKILKGNTFSFDKNNNQMLKPKRWEIEEKK